MASIAVEAFTRDLLVNSFGTRKDKSSWRPKNAVEYAFEYLTALNASVVVIEDQYVDRHYLDDFAAYYAKSFNTPSASCRRLHFFKRLTAASIDAAMSRAYGPDRSKALSELQQDYLGFIVQRPIDRARMGRTVLVTYPEANRRRYSVVRTYRVNIGGIPLEVRGLAFQEQDGGAAVCASTALWAALQRVARVSGHRSPTPSQITSAAKSPYPASHGLELSQMATALRSLGYVADQFVPAENRPLFRAKVVACLDSQLPVILAVTKKTSVGEGVSLVGHALTLTGYSAPESIVPIPPLAADTPAIPMRSADLRIVYAHDDNLGFHAHYELKDSDQKDENGNRELILFRGRSDKPKPPWLSALPDEWVIQAALVPKPDKLRFPVESLFLDIVALKYLFDAVLPDAPPISWGARFTTGLEYRERVLAFPVDRTAIRRFQEELNLPRHLGILSVFSGDAPILDVLIDVTEYQRDPTLPSILAFVGMGLPKGSPPALNFSRIAARFGVPIIFAPPTS